MSFSTTTTVTPSYPVIREQDSVTFTITVTSTGGTPTGNVDLTDTLNAITTTLATLALSGGTATYTTNLLALGTHTITANYAGAGLFLASSGDTTEVVVQLKYVPAFAFEHHQ